MPERKHHHDESLLKGTTRSLSLLLCLGALAGVLIWAKLRLVTDIPRSAYADPRERQVDGDQADTGVDADGTRGDGIDALENDDLEHRAVPPQTGERAEPSAQRP